MMFSMLSLDPHDTWFLLQPPVVPIVLGVSSTKSSKSQLPAWPGWPTPTPPDMLAQG